MNKVILTGRLARDAELKQLVDTDRNRLNFTLAVQREYKNANGETEADFIPVVMWSKAADKLQRYLLKGRLISVSGRVNVSSYEGVDGNKKYSTQIIAEDIEFLEGKKSEAV